MVKILEKRRTINWMAVMAVALFVLAFGGKTEASEGGQKENRFYTDVTVIATVPEGYNKDVIVWFKNGVDEDRAFLLQEAQEYKSTMMLIEGTYETSAEGKNFTDFACEMEDTCVVEGSEMEFHLTVLSTPPAVSEDVAQAILAENAEEISTDIPGMDSGKEVFQEFLENAEYVQETEYFKTVYSKLNESDKWKKQFLEFEGDDNTEEEWNSMSSFDIFVYFETFRKPYVNMMTDTYSNEDEFVEDATVIKIFRGEENGEAFADALEKVIRWQYRYFEQTGTLYNFFAEEGEENAHLNRTETDGNGLTAEESKEVAELREELLEGEDIKDVLEEETQTDNSLVRLFKEHMIAVIVLIVSGIAIIIVVIYIKSKKNSVDE